jgi:hypothetical protein
MPRPKKSHEEKVHLSMQVPPALLAQIDEEASRLTAELRISVNRTEALGRMLDELKSLRAAAREVRP